MDEDTQAYDATLESIKGNIYDLTGLVSCKTLIHINQLMMY